jgi:parvulin-like peptidyl-prolyl isomerase
VRKKAEELVKRAQSADAKPGEDFAELARKNSEDTKSKAAGRRHWMDQQERQARNG